MHFPGFSVLSSKKRNGAPPAVVLVGPSNCLWPVPCLRCIACVVTYVLYSEPTIRLVLVACRLSRFLRKQDSERNLPLFDFWRASLRKVLDNDPFWGPSYAKEIEAKAAQLEQGLLQLIQQCYQLSDVAMAHGTNPSNGRRLGCVTPYHAHAAESDKTQPSILSKQQTKDMLLEEQGWMQKIVHY